MKLALAGAVLLAGVLWYMQTGPVMGALLCLLVGGIWTAIELIRVARRSES
jgi:hypothetical protein